MRSLRFDPAARRRIHPTAQAHRGQREGSHGTSSDGAIGNQANLRARASGSPARSPARFPHEAERALPHRQAIERSFGPGHDFSGIKAQIGGSAGRWNATLGATASTRGDRMAFSGEPTLDEAAHEAAHVVQQRQGAFPPGGLSRARDGWELQADAVAERVTRGESATDLLGRGTSAGTPSSVPIQTRLIAHGTAGDVARFFAMAEPASGLDLERDPTTDIVTPIASLVGGPTSPSFEAMLANIIDDPLQNAEIQFGEHQAAPLVGGGLGGVFLGAFPIAAPQIQIVDMDDLEAVEAGAPGQGVAALAHELQENFVAHSLPPGIASFGPPHAAGNVAQENVARELVGPGRELLEYVVPNPAGGSSFIQDYENYFLVIDFAAAPAPPLTSALPDNVVTGVRPVPPTVVASFTIDSFATGSDAVPPNPLAVAAVSALLTADSTAAVHIEGFTDSVGTAASNLALGQRRAAAGRALLGAGFGNRAAAIGRGEVSFVAPNNTEANKARNRRIVFTVVRP